MSKNKLDATMSFIASNELKVKLIENAKLHNMNLSQYLRYILKIHFENIPKDE
jgi:hypothetical protein